MSLYGQSGYEIFHFLVHTLKCKFLTKMVEIIERVNNIIRLQAAERVGSQKEVEVNSKKYTRQK